MKHIIMIILLCLMFSVSVYAIQPTQQYNKVLLTPFYINSMSQNIQYNYTVDISTPDGISDIKSAIITLDAWINPTRVFNAWMNNIQCNTKNYTISTTYASAGRGVITFDCSNAVMPNMVNNVSFIVSNGNIGSSTAWIDLTYMNNPKGYVDLHGTEYIAGDDGKMFLQFLDSDDMPVNNSECFITLWYPDNTVLLNNTLMSYLDDGIYYKNFLVPTMTGVYPASAKCYRPIIFNNMILYNQTGDNFETNNYIGGYNWSECPLGDPDCQNGWDYDLLKTVIVANASAGTGGCYNSNYCARIDGSYGFLERGFPENFIEGTIAYNITFKYKFLGFQTNELAEVYVFDGNWHLLEQIGLTGGRTNGVWYSANYYIEDSEYNLETMLLGFFAYTMPSSNDYFYIDDVYIHYTGTNITLSNDTQYQILRGSGEVHVSSLYNNIFNLTNNISSQVWSYPVRNLTYYQNFSILQEDLTNYSRIFEGVWNYSIRNLTYYQNFTVPQEDLTNYSRIFEGVWNYSIRNLTYYQNFTVPQEDLTNYSMIQDMIYAMNISLYNLIIDTNFSISNILYGLPNDIWTYTFRNLTYYPMQEDLTNYSRINEGVWNHTVRNLTYYPMQENINYSLITENVWDYVGRYVHGVLI